MAKLPTTTRRSINLLLENIADTLQVGMPLPTETRMSELTRSSRTAVRSALAYLAERGIIHGLQERTLKRRPIASDYFDADELQTGTERLQDVLMQWIYQRDLPPGAEFSEADLSRVAGVSTIAVREFLIAFSHHGLIEKLPRGGWRLCAFDRKYAEELGEAREIFELRAIDRLSLLSPGDPAFAQLANLLARHEALCRAPDAAFVDFPGLDREFHTFLIGQLDNRFADHLNNIVSLVYHYHYQWDKRDELPRNQYAVQEHLDILRPLCARQFSAAQAAMRTHLRSARTTMLASLQQREGRPQRT